MKKFSTILCLVITLILTTSSLADNGIEELKRELQDHDSYAARLEGRDGDGEFSALYFHSPELRVLRRKDRKGKVVFEYDKRSRTDKVTVTRGGVAYRYKLDNPLLPSHFPDSLVEFLVGQATGEASVEQTDEGTSESYRTEDGGVVTFLYGGDGSLDSIRYEASDESRFVLRVTNLMFDPQTDTQEFSRLNRYIRRVN